MSASIGTLCCIEAITLSPGGIEESFILILSILYLNDLVRKHLKLIVTVLWRIRNSFLYELILISGSETIGRFAASYNICSQLFSMILY